MCPRHLAAPVLPHDRRECLSPPDVVFCLAGCGQAGKHSAAGSSSQAVLRRSPTEWEAPQDSHQPHVRSCSCPQHRNLYAGGWAAPDQGLNTRGSCSASTVRRLSWQVQLMYSCRCEVWLHLLAPARQHRRHVCGPVFAGWLASVTTLVSALPDSLGKEHGREVSLLCAHGAAGCSTPLHLSLVPTQVMC